MEKLTAALLMFLQATLGGSAWAAAPAADQRSYQRDLLTCEEPLVATAPTSASEDLALFHAIRSYTEQAAPDDFRVFDAFLADYPRSGWRVALLIDLGLSYYHYGYFSKAIDSWEQAWAAGQSVHEPRVTALVDRPVGGTALKHARLGHADRIEALLREIGDRPITGAATETGQAARERLWTMRTEPGTADLCAAL